MSDDEYEYDYDDQDEEMQDTFEYTDEEEEQDDGQVALENAYYNAKGLRDSSVEKAVQAFEELLTKEQHNPTLWSFKALKQLVKLHIRHAHKERYLRDYQRLLAVVAKGEIPPNAMEKGMHTMLDRLPSEGAVYDATITCFHPTTGACPNERLWFKTTLKYGQLCMELNQLAKLQVVLRDLSKLGSSGSHQMEIYAQESVNQKNLKQVRKTFEKAMAVRGGIPHPRTLALIQELGGKMFMASKEYESASTTFFQAFKSYDEAGDPSRLKCLKYLVMASMLHASTINPFDSQEARPYKDAPEIVAMTSLVSAFHNNEIQQFELTLKRNHDTLMGDDFCREHMQDLLRTIRRQVLTSVIRPYTRISLAALAEELNGISIVDVEQLLIGLILDGTLQGDIDQMEGVLYKTTTATTEIVDNNDELLQELVESLEALSTTVTSVKFKGAKSQGMSVH